jgi:hypothetical protein
MAVRTRKVSHQSLGHVERRQTVDFEQRLPLGRDDVIVHRSYAHRELPKVVERTTKLCKVVSAAVVLAVESGKLVTESELSNRRT